eukprot:gnl/MRDRNA2_/MRDRNA2_30463_c0_seq1.p1 gnl/MRDRNA2_/MRDRNA2_30463_c0~~gnl/MRDRNA2_/MRDRNA2_30463_c0_seq1.p1  ORF type:complete len:311 (-),score=71.36 gnl/MRDRNA2_/MRDRNA2_30463_c0_seq1:10-942(-)
MGGMAPAIPKLPLVPGLGIPALGFGAGTAWFKAAAPGQEKAVALKESVFAALDAGFRYVDEAEVYQNEAITGTAIKEWMARSGVPRKELFITHKVISVDDPGIIATCQKSLERMGVDYFDLYLIHAPFKRDGSPHQRSLKDAWADMENLVDQGLVKAIGVSNFKISHLGEILDGARIKPVCNQIEAHPYLQQPELLDWCKARDILVTGYSPLASITHKPFQGGPVDAPVAAAAQHHGKTPAQVLLRWNLQTGRGVVTTTSQKDRLIEYLGIFDFVLSEEEVMAISAAGAPLQPRRVYWGQHGLDDPPSKF